MKRFEMREVKEAIAHARAGGQALHLHSIIVDRDRAPACFVRAIDRGEQIAHLFDLDVTRLIRTAMRLGVGVVVIERRNMPTQHIDLCGAPLRRALELCE